MTKLYFVRHGQSETNVQDVFCGYMNAPLTEKGRRQAELTARYLADVHFDAVYASDLDRAAETGRIVAAPHGLAVHTTPELREVNGGEWEGIAYLRLPETHPREFGVWKNTIGLAVCPGGESVAYLQQRVRKAVESIVLRHPDQCVCIATHATPIRVMECIWKGIPLALMHTVPWVSNASVTIVEYDRDGRFRLIAEDIHDHLGALSTQLSVDL